MLYAFGFLWISVSFGFETSATVADVFCRAGGCAPNFDITSACTAAQSGRARSAATPSAIISARAACAAASASCEATCPT